jgi:hypothetical protein
MKYGKLKYSKGKYGRYDLPTDQEGALSQGTRYRIRSISSGIKSSPVGNLSISFPTTAKPSAIRIRSNLSEYVTQQNADISGSTYKIRVKAVTGSIESSWVESVIGTVRLKEGE